MVEMAGVGAPISLDGWQSIQIIAACVIFILLQPENPEDGKMYLLVPAHPGCPGQSPESHKMVVCCVCLPCTCGKNGDRLYSLLFFRKCSLY